MIDISTIKFHVLSYMKQNENVVADALSKLFSNYSPGMEQSRAEIACHDVVGDNADVMNYDTICTSAIGDLAVGP